MELKNLKGKEQGEQDNTLSKKGYKITKAREAVMHVLENSESPVSAEEIYINIRNMGQSVNLSTVYRTLELLEKKGFAMKEHIGDGKARYELNRDVHKHHIICTSCRDRVSIDICPLQELHMDLGAKTQFDITGHKLELYGICPKCKRK